jgi:NAD(P)H-nitrite reductase large subunit
MVTESEILQILKKGARDLEDVKKFTLASTSCGRCKIETESIIKRYFDNKQIDLQQNIDF